ncbi:MAG: UDP-3-O-(3-hydroxymyristoyl)glucosamine N-acyltransferase [Pseudomonadota bacterium]
MWRVADIATALGFDSAGDLDQLIEGAAAPSQARPNDLAIASTPEYAERLSEGGAVVALLWAGADWQAYGLKSALFAPRPRFALAGVTALMEPRRGLKPGIHHTAYVDPSAQVDPSAEVGAMACIESGASIGAKSRVGPHSVIAADAKLGCDTWLAERVTVGADVEIGDRVTIQSGAVIGADGFSFVTAEKSDVESVRETLGTSRAVTPQVWSRIHSLASVRLDDDVEIGANTCIDRGTLADTRIGRGTKIDNLVQIGHNVEVGEDCLLCGQVGIAGSSVLGNRVVLGGQAGVTDHVRLGDDVIAGAGTMVRTNQPAGKVLLGDPAMPMTASIESYKALRRLPRLAAEVARLKTALQKSNDAD